MAFSFSSAQAASEPDFPSIIDDQSAADFVVPLALDDLVIKKANLFDLEGKTLRFTPQRDGGYTIATLPGAELVPSDQLLEDARAEPAGTFEAKGWAVPLSFSFPFGGKTWNKIYVNRNGNLSFAKHEGAYWSQRNPWPDAGMRSMAAALDSDSAAGLEQMIAVLWAPYDPNPALSQVRIQSENGRFAATWNVIRNAAGQVIAGPCTFQVRIYPSGVIEMAYPRVPEKDGIVGLFTGQPVYGSLLHHWQPHGSAADSSVAIDSADIYDAGSTLRFVLNMKSAVPSRVPAGTMLAYRCLFRVNGNLEQIAANVADQPSGSSSLGTSSPHTAGFHIQGKMVEIYISKIALTGCRQFTPGWNVTWWGVPGHFDQSPGNLSQSVDLSLLDPAETNLSAAPGLRSGNIFEVFHYPAVTKSSDALLKSIYQHQPAHDDIAYVFTDFRIDDLYGQGTGARATNFPIHGIGPDEAAPRSTKELGSSQLQANIANVWIGAPLFAESGVTPDGWSWRNFARGVCWLAHETTHRWGLHLSTRDPRTGQEVNLTNDVGHWLDGMNTPALWPVADHYLDRPAQGASIMGGSAWKENADGTFSKAPYPWAIPGGWTALDLYIMGLLPPEKVPETFLLTNLKDLGNNRYQAVKIPVRIQDIVSVMGPRTPASADAQKTFHLKVYLLYESGRDVDPALLERAQRLSAAVVNFFSRASGGEMKVVPSDP